MIGIEWIGFVIASVAIVLAPGPGSLFVARTAAASGLRAGHKAMVGIMFGDTCLIILSVLGVSAIFRAYPSVFHVFRLAGVAYLAFLGLKLVFRKSKTESVHISNRDRSFLQAVSITLLNPKAVFFFMAFFPLFLRSSDHSRLLAYAAMAVAFQFISMTYLGILIRASSWTAAVLRKKQSGQGRVGESLRVCVYRLRNESGTHEKMSESGSRGFFSPVSHTTRHAGPHLAVHRNYRAVAG
jgi:leucine efflux protein